MNKEIRIAVNTRYLIPNKMDGIGWFSYQTIKRIVEKHPEIHFYFLFDRTFHPEFIFADTITPIILSPPARHPILIYYWNEWAVPNLLNKLQPDLYLSLDGLVSRRAKYKQYAVLHDLNFIVFPEYLTYSVKKLYDYFLVKNIQHADRVATVSNFSKSEIVHHLNYPENKIDVVYSASNLNRIPDSNINDAIRLKNQYTKGMDYFIYVGSIIPRKNIEGLIKAFELYKERVGNTDKLILVGKFFWGKKYLLDLLTRSKYSNDIIFAGRLDDDTRTLLIKHARALLLVSHYEGFGVPVIEAMQVGTPVITSNTTSLDEIAGDAAIKVNPKDVAEIARSMEKIAKDPELVKALTAKGKLQAKKYHWDNSADLLWEGIAKVIYK